MRRALANPSRDTQRGVVIVELALMLPIYVVLLVVIVDLGLVLREYQVLQNAAREGARYSVHPPNWIDPRNPPATAAAIQGRVVEYLQQEGITVGAGSVSVTQAAPIVVGGLTLKASRVDVSYDRGLLIPAAGLLPTPTIRLTATAVFRNLY